MNARERVLRALHHELTDRVPFSMEFAPDLASRLREHVGQADLESYFDWDIRYVTYATD